MSILTSRRALVILSTVVISVLTLAGPVGAQDSGGDLGDDDQVVLHGQLIVPEGETVGAGVIFDGPARVEGTITDSLVVFNGRVEITGTIGGDVVAFNGDVVVRDGATVNGDLVTQGSTQVEPGATVRGEQRSIATGSELADVGIAGRFAWWLAYSISTLVLGLVLLLFAPRLDDVVSWASRSRTGASIGVGVAAFLLLPIVALVLLATIVGIPLGLFLLLGIALIYTVGYVAGAHAIGRRLVKDPKSRYLAFLAGWGIVRVLGLIPFVGGLVWVLVTIFGLGALLVASRRTYPGTSLDARTPPPAPVPAS